MEAVHGRLVEEIVLEGKVSCREWVLLSMEDAACSALCMACVRSFKYMDVASKLTVQEVLDGSFTGKVSGSGIRLERIHELFLHVRCTFLCMRQVSRRFCPRPRSGSWILVRTLFSNGRYYISGIEGIARLLHILV